MIIHIAIFKWKSDVIESEIEKTFKEIKQLEKKIPGVQSIYCGVNYSKWAQGFTHGVVVIAENQEALDSYRTHPDHEIIANKVDSMEENGIGIDFVSL